MAISNYVLWIDVVTFLLVLLSLIFLIKTREYEKSVFESSINVMLFAMLLMILIKLIDIASGVNMNYPAIISKYGIETYIVNAITISGVVLLPLFAVCVLISVIFAKDSFDLEK